MGSISAKPSTASHYNDWPNIQGFDVSYEERNPIELVIKGRIPAYVAGTLFRTGLGPRDFKTPEGKLITRVNHWFDNLALIHRFQIHVPDGDEAKARVTYNSRMTSDGLIERVQKTGKLDSFTFAARYDPCKTFFQKLQSAFTPARATNELQPNEFNFAVTMSVNYPGGFGNTTSTPQSNRLDNVCVKTDAATIQRLDPETLEPIGLAAQDVLHPLLKGVLSAAHAKSDPKTGDVYNYNLDFGGQKATYRVFRTSASTGKTTILATFKHDPVYLHSFFITENYVVLCAWNSHFKAYGASILWNKNLLDSMYFNSNTNATWFVIDKRCPDQESGRGVIATYKSDPFFCFHSINAFEEKNPETGETDIVADLAAYPNMDVLHHFFLDNILSNSPAAGPLVDPDSKLYDPNIRARLRTYRLPSIPKPQLSPSTSPSRRSGRRQSSNTSTSTTANPTKAILEYEEDIASSVELPTINPLYLTKLHRYIYGTDTTKGQSTFIDGLTKYDRKTHTTTYWSQKGHTPGEAIFIPDPTNSTDEDGGALLTVVLDGYTGKSYMLVLDAKDMTEIGRAEVPGPIGFGFHGIHTRATAGGPRGLGSHVDI